MKIVKSFVMVMLATAVFAAPKPVSLKVNAAESKVEWFASKVTGKHNGTVGVKSGILDFDGDKLKAAKIEIDMTTLAVSDLQGEWGGKLLGHLKSDDFFSVEKFNTSTLTVKKADQIAPGRYKIVADLNIKGIVKEVSFDAGINQAAGTAAADIKLNRTDFDIKYGSTRFFPNIGDKAIHDEFTLKVALVFGKAM